MPHEELPFWHFNVPVDKRTVECPDFLLNLCEKDQRLIGMWDSHYEVLTWEELLCIIQTNRIDLLRRSPSHLRRYRQFVHGLTETYGSVLSFIVNNRLFWTDLTPKGPPFSNPDDWKILYNDWPYGVDKRIVHLVVWTKFSFAENPVNGDLTTEARAEIQNFVDDMFVSAMGEDKVVWFKNWKSLKSVHAIEHFHVMLYDPDPAFVHHVTQGDRPYSLVLQAEESEDSETSEESKASEESEESEESETSDEYENSEESDKSEVETP